MDNFQKPSAYKSVNSSTYRQQEYDEDLVDSTPWYEDQNSYPNWITEGFKLLDDLTNGIKNLLIK
jgi:hypothetical protein